MKGAIYSTIFLLISILVSCDPSMVYEKYISTENGMWKWTDPGEFEVNMTDTTSFHNIYIQVRHTVDYPLSNLYMFVHVKGPAGQLLKDTVNLVLATPDGSWTGRGAGHLRELSLLYRKHTQFRQTGIYTFTLEQGMRNPELPVTEMGIRIERINP